MAFEGHEFKKLEDNWVFDMTTFTGYKVKLNGDKVVKYTKAYIAKFNSESDEVEFFTFIPVSIAVLRKTINVIHKYRKEALLDAR